MARESNCKDCFNSSATEPSLLTVHWLETEAVHGFKVWQIMFLCFAGILALIIMLCCCIRFRIPRTKQEIEADYKRKKITKKFQKQLRMIQNSDMDEMDLKKALDRIRAEFKSDTESLAQSDILSEATLNSGNYRSSGDMGAKNLNCTENIGIENDVGVTLDTVNNERKSIVRLPVLASIFAKLKSRQKPQGAPEK